MKSHQLMVVAPVCWNSDLLADWNFYSLNYRFVDQFPADGLSAQRVGSTENGEAVDVFAPCEAFSGGFAQHALNRLFARALLRCRPKVVIIVGLAGCTVDLPRVADMLGIPVLLILGEPSEQLDDLNLATQTWIQASLLSCVHVYSKSPEWTVSWLHALPLADIGRLVDDLTFLTRQVSPGYAYDYSIYEFCERDHPLMVNMQRGDTHHFEGCSRVLDLACGAGVFLDCLRQSGIPAQGVERNPQVARYARGMGLEITTEDALAFLENTVLNFDGVYCSHFIEHLPIDAVQRSLALVARKMTGGGVLVLVFPDPESIRTQLLGFWRDPEHVRLYHPELIVSMASTVGLELEWSSYADQPHHVVPFDESPPPVPQVVSVPPLLGPASITGYGLGERILQKFGLVSERRLRHLEERLLQWSSAVAYQSQSYAEASSQLEKRTSALWNVNLTWAWNDNVTLRFRKSAN